MTARPELGLGILLAASLPPEAIARILGCDIHAAEAFKLQAKGDLVALQAQISGARKVRN